MARDDETSMAVNSTNFHSFLKAASTLVNTSRGLPESEETYENRSVSDRQANRHESKNDVVVVVVGTDVKAANTCGLQQHASNHSRCDKKYVRTVTLGEVLYALDGEADRPPRGE